MYRFFSVVLLSILSFTGFAQENTNVNKFRQLKQELATPNVYRTGSGAPGHEYYQQKADYKIDLTLDDKTQSIKGLETITYTNNSPDKLSYLWLQLDQNMRAPDSDRSKINDGNIGKKMSFSAVQKILNDFPGGFKIDYIRDARGSNMKYIINKTMLRIDLAKPLKPGQKISFSVKYSYNINDRMKIGGRSGYEYFKKDDNYLYTIAQFYPRMAVYNDVEGWQNKQFLGRGEFALPFGDYEVKITVPADHIVASTGELQNPNEVLTAEQRKRFETAKTAKHPYMIVTPEEAAKNEKTKSKKTKTWVFKAKNVRDFGFASSRKFIWDAKGVKFGNRTVMAMSYYPNEGNPLWEQYSTRAVEHTLNVYSKFTFDYPYPVAISVNSKKIGMEYPMICFNFGRPEDDGTYTDRTKYGMIGVIIHEVGHNYFPMIVNSDERQWTWMDEGLNTFLQYLTEQEWETNYPSRRGPAHKIVDYMKGDKSQISPIMTNSESIWQFGNNAYGKPATALNILRETIMGRELFDFAFKTYAQRWMFKHPTPADFFRTMEDASAVDLDWFWRGWFYTTDHCDISLDDVKWFQISTKNPKIEKPFAKKMDTDDKKAISNLRNKDLTTYMDGDENIIDFYNKYDPYEVDLIDEEEYARYIEKLDENEKKLLESNLNFYQLDFSNKGGLVMPIIIQCHFKSGKVTKETIPAEVWRKDNFNAMRLIVSEEEIIKIEIDPNLETADTDRNNNFWPKQVLPTRFELFKSDKEKENPMQRSRRAKQLEEKK